MRIAEPRVIRSLNASGGGVKTFMFVSVWKGITHLNAIEATQDASLVKRDGWSSNRRQNEVVTIVYCEHSFRHQGECSLCYS